MDARVPGWKRIGVKAGDLLVKNDFVSAVILTAARDAKSMRVGQCIVLDGAFDDSREPVAVGPGPRGVWKRAELIKNGEAIQVRFRHEGDDWAAELVYRIDGASPWLEVRTTIRNRSKDRTLELPLVDDLRVPEQSTVADDAIEAVTVARENPGWVVAIAPADRKAKAAPADDDRWFMIFESGDPTPSMLKRMRPKLLPLLKTDIFQPVTVERDWTRTVKDREHWFRVEPEGERTVVRRVLFCPTMAEAKSLAAFARGSQASKLKVVDTAPTKSNRLATSAKPPSPTVKQSASLTRRIVGTLRGQPTKPSPPAGESDPTSPFVVKPKSTATPEWRQAPKTTAGSGDAKPAGPPTGKSEATKSAILNIPNLPPPIDDGK